MNVTMYHTKFEVQIFPEGEEMFHAFDFECECEPFISMTDDGKPLCQHHSWSTEEILDIAEYSLFHNVRQEFDC